MAEKQVKVALWCVARSMSTVFTKSLSAIDDMEVYFELYTMAAIVGGGFQTATGRKLPLKLEGNEADYELANAAWYKEAKANLIPKRISCHDIKTDLENTKSKFVLIKEMCQVKDYVEEYLPQDFRYVFMTREPSRVFASFRKALLTSGLFVPPDGNLDIIRDDPAAIFPMTWFEKQHQLWKYVKENLDPNPIIIDSFDLASQPRKVLNKFCDAVGFPYSDTLLQWSPSIQDFPKNFVTAGEDLFQGAGLGFYGRAFSSTHFEAPTESGPISRDQLSDDVIRCVDHSMPFYRELYENRMQVS